VSYWISIKLQESLVRVRNLVYGKTPSLSICTFAVGVCAWLTFVPLLLQSLSVPPVRDRYCKINYCIYLVGLSQSMTYWSQSLIPSDDTRINGIYVGVSRVAGETVC
jgi:hypothetical protein